MSFCLIPKHADALKKDLISGKVDPRKLAEMSSEQRRAFFAERWGEAPAKEVNTLFESKLLLKNQQLGMINWAKQILNMKPEIKRDIITRIQKMDKVLTPETEKSFLHDIAEKKLGTSVTYEEAHNIAELSNRVTEAEAKVKPDEPIGSPNRLEYGASKVALTNYVADLKISNSKMGLTDYAKNPGKIISSLASASKGIKASLDNSALFRQGWKTLFTNPKIWANNAVKSFQDIGKVMGGKKALDAVKAEIYSRPNEINGNYKRMKLDIGNMEEAFPSTLPEKIPLFGRLYKASEQAYVGFLYRMRADIADKLISVAEMNDINIKDPVEAKSIGTLVNSLTGRGNLGALEKVGKQVNTIFFSPKMLKSNIDFLTLHAFDNMSSFARKQSAINLLKVVSGISVILATAKALNPDSVELDPKSSDFGKIRIGDTRFDVSGGMSSLVVLATRLLTQSSKSSVTGRISKLNSGEYKATTGMDVIWNFMENKFSPAMQMTKELLINKTDFQGKPITAGKALSDAFVPLPITNAYEVLNNPNGANALLTIIADGLGITTNTYSPK